MSEILYFIFGAFVALVAAMIIARTLREEQSRRPKRGRRQTPAHLDRGPSRATVMERGRIAAKAERLGWDTFPGVEELIRNNKGA